MRRRFLWAVVCVWAAVLLLSGCREEEPAVITENQVWETMPQLNYGTLESEKLAVVPWYDGRTEASSQCTMAETELGYYWSLAGYLLYADKANLGNWVVVCNQPECDHSMNWSYGEVKCNGKNLLQKFVLRNGRIIYPEMNGHVQEVTFGKGSEFVLVSRAADGTDLRLEFALKDNPLGQGGGSCHVEFTSTQFIIAASAFQEDGRYKNTMYRITKDGAALVEEFVGDDTERWVFGRSMLGEEVFLVHDTQSHYRFVGDTKELVYQGPLNGYLSGNTMRVYRLNDGYYDVALDSLEETFLAPARFENSTSVFLLPNCIIETTFFVERRENPVTESRGEMAVFDGTQWRDVQFPEELTAGESALSVGNFAVTSDSIFFTVTTADKPFFQYGGMICRIDLSKEDFEVEICQNFEIPSDEEEE